MKTTIDAAGRGGIPARRMSLVERHGLLAAEVEGEKPAPLTVDEVRSLLERARR